MVIEKAPGGLLLTAESLIDEAFVERLLQVLDVPGVEAQIEFTTRGRLGEVDVSHIDVSIESPREIF